MLKIYSIKNVYLISNVAYCCWIRMLFECFLMHALKHLMKLKMKSGLRCTYQVTIIVALQSFCSGCGMFGTCNVWNERCSGCGMFRMRNVWGGMFGMLGVRSVRCWKIGMFRMWDIRDLGCWGVGCLKCGMFGM